MAGSTIDRRYFPAFNELSKNLGTAASDYQSMRTGHLGLGGWCVAMAARMDNIYNALHAEEFEAVVNSATAELGEFEVA